MLPIVTDMHDLVRIEAMFLHGVHKHIGFGLTGIELIGPIPFEKNSAGLAMMSVVPLVSAINW